MRQGLRNRLAQDEAWCLELLKRLRWPEGVMCPLCDSRRVTGHSRPAGSPRRRYLCLVCRRTFTDLTGTPFAASNLPLSLWFRHLRLMRERMLIVELAREMDVKWDTAWRMRRRLAVALAQSHLVQKLRDVVEAEDWSLRHNRKGSVV